MLRVGISIVIICAVIWQSHSQEYDFAAEMTRQCLVPDPVGLLDCVENKVTLPYMTSWVECTNSLGQNVKTSTDIINYRCKSVWEGKGLIPEVFFIKDCVIEKTGLPAKNVSAEVLGAYKECESSPNTQGSPKTAPIQQQQLRTSTVEYMGQRNPQVVAPQAQIPTPPPFSTQIPVTIKGPVQQVFQPQIPYQQQLLAPVPPPIPISQQPFQVPNPRPAPLSQQQFQTSIPRPAPLSQQQFQTTIARPASLSQQQFQTIIPGPVPLSQQQFQSPIPRPSPLSQQPIQSPVSRPNPVTQQQFQPFMFPPAPVINQQQFQTSMPRPVPITSQQATSVQFSQQQIPVSLNQQNRPQVSQGPQYLTPVTNTAQTFATPIQRQPFSQQYFTIYPQPPLLTQPQQVMTQPILSMKTAASPSYISQKQIDVAGPASIKTAPIVPYTYSFQVVHPQRYSS